MNAQTIARAWKDASFRSSLSAADQAALPANPAGPTELADDALEAAAGAEVGCGMWCTVTLDCAKSYFTIKACKIYNLG